MKKIDIAGAFDQDPGYESESYQLTDDDLNEEQLFKKFVPIKFPNRIARQLIDSYPGLKMDNKKFLESIKMKSAIFHGVPGTGKTFHACALVLLSRKVGWYYLKEIQFYRVPELYRKLRTLVISDEIDPENGKKMYDSFIHKLSGCRYLILDDLGIEKGSDFTVEVLDQIIDHRYQTKKATIVTTNGNPEELIQYQDYTRIMSRLVDMADGLLIELKKNYRKVERKTIVLK